MPASSRRQKISVILQFSPLRSNFGVGWSRDSNSRGRVSKEECGRNKGRVKSIPKADINSYNLAPVCRLYLPPCAKLCVPSDLCFDLELVNRLPNIQTEAEFYIVMSEHFVGFPSSSGTGNYAHGDKGT